MCNSADSSSVVKPLSSCRMNDGLCTKAKQRMGWTLAKYCSTTRRKLRPVGRLGETSLVNHVSRHSHRESLLFVTYHDRISDPEGSIEATLCKLPRAGISPGTCGSADPLLVNGVAN